MADMNDIPVVDVRAEKQKIESEKKQLKADAKRQKQEAKKRAKELQKQEDSLIDDEESSGGFPAVIITIVIVVIWLAILCLLIKLDVGGFGSGVLKPMLKDVPVLNLILPDDHVTETTDEEEFGGYTSLRDAVEQIRLLELQLEQAQTLNATDSDTLEEMRKEIIRLQTFEDSQLEFEKIKNEFYEEVIYAENGPGVDEYVKYFEAMDPVLAQALYQQVVKEKAADKQMQDYALAYSSMKPKEAAAIFEQMGDDIELVARILDTMTAEDRGGIMGVMNEEFAAKLTKIMDPEND
ncbi:MAG: hypothetical protein KBS85_02880 [Lachnospiraceae bacterium]|nr:hypothetical protein [Candidatus Merdinaster equi]